MIELPEITKAWMAGFFDGEGTIGIKRGKAKPLQGRPSPDYTLRIGVANTVYSGVEPFRMYFGGYIATKKEKRYKARLLYMWQASARDAMRVLECLLPYLRLKQKQAELGIWLQKQKRHHRGRLPLPVAYLGEYERIRLAIQELNRGFSPSVLTIEAKSKQLPLIERESQEGT